MFLIPCILVSFDATPYSLLLPAILARNPVEGFSNDKPSSATGEEFKQ
jgi:hypothetical protein